MTLKVFMMLLYKECAEKMTASFSLTFVLGCLFVFSDFLFIMPKYYEDPEEDKAIEKKKYACEGIRDDLIECLSQTDCVRKVIDGASFNYMHIVVRTYFFI